MIDLVKFETKNEKSDQLLINAMDAMISGVTKILEDLKLSFGGNLDRQFYLYLDSKSLKPGIPMGRFNFKNDDVQKIVDHFTSMLSNMVQSEKNHDLKLSDQFILSMKVLGIPHMAQIRAAERAYFEELNLPNFGPLKNAKKSKTKKDPSPYLEIPNGFHSAQNTENCFSLFKIKVLILKKLQKN